MRPALAADSRPARLVGRLPAPCRPGAGRRRRPGRRPGSVRLSVLRVDPRRAASTPSRSRWGPSPSGPTTARWNAPRDALAARSPADTSPR